MALMGMETDSSSFPSSSSSSAARRKYDVFLSFRGEDTRNTFADLLHEAFKQKGIDAFKDDEKLEKGKTISPALSRAIEESRFAVVIFSKNYASSTWCLDELAKIIHCEEHMGMKILPVFYDVELSDVRKQLGTFAQAFIEHEKRFKENIEKVKMWRAALTHVGNIVGWPLMNRPLSQVIKSIVRLIWHNLNNDTFLEVIKGLVGIDSHVVELESRLALWSNDVHFIGIWAMGGMGKTTLAWVVYHMISKDFEACSFIENVRENFEKKEDFVPIQQKIIDQILMEKDLKIKDKYDGVVKIKNGLRHKRILLVLDDVDKPDMLNMLAREHDWFGPGSRIIITTRYMQVLETHEVDEIYEVKGLNDENALQLFCLKAFKKEHVPDDYIGLSSHFLEYAGGLPLALEVLGSFLFGKSTDEWKSALERLKEYPNPEVFHVLQISFHGLHDTEKEIFLHIACFFNHNKKDYVVEVLDNLGLHAGIGLKELVDKSLLKIMDYDVVWMHDLLEEMGNNIVFQECPDDPGKRSRLCFYKDIDKVLRKNKGTEAVQAMSFWGGWSFERATWNPDAFLKMNKLKFLKVHNNDYVTTHLPDDLRILDWTGYPSKSLPSSFQSDELVQLRLQQSNIEQLWIGIMHFQKLKFIDLTNSPYLIITPDFTGVQNLEILVLNGCKKLRELHPSIGFLKKLVRLDLMYCEKLICLPSTICSLKSLESLDLSRCSNLDNLPENLVNIKGLKRLDLSGTAIKELPLSIECLTSLTSLNVLNCKNLECLPNTTCGFKFHGALDLSTCSRFKNLPENPWIIEGLGKLDLSNTAIEVLPSSIERLTNLTILTLKDCVNLVCLPNTTCGFKFDGALDLSSCPRFKNLPENPWIIEDLEMLDLSKTAIEEMPSSIDCLTNLTTLTLRYCMNLVRLPSTICNLKLLKSLDLFGCLRFDNLPEHIGNMRDLEVLNLCWTAIKEVPSSVVLLNHLKQLHIRGWKLSQFDSSPASLESLDQISNFLFFLPTGPAMERISLPSFVYDSLPTSSVLVGLLLPSLSGLKSLTYLHLSDFELSSIPNDIGCLSSLELLNLSGNNFVTLPESISQLSNLRRLYLEGCKRLQSLENVPSTIDFVIANYCTSLERLPQLQFYPFRSDHSRLNFQCLNCFKLVDNIQSSSNMFQRQSGRLPELLDIIIPGSEIPKWFNHEFTGHELNIQVPSRGCDELMGIALSVVFVPNNCDHCPINWDLSCSFNGFLINCREHFDFSVRPKHDIIESHHLWLLYLSLHSNSNWRRILIQTDANGSCQLNIKIDSWTLKVEKIGVHLVYQQDMKDPNQTMAQCSNSTTLYEVQGVLHQDFDHSTAESFRHKRSCDEAISSGEGYSNGEPQSKRIQGLGGFITDSEVTSQTEIFDFSAVEGEDQTSKKIEAICGGNNHQDIEDLNQTLAQCSNNNSTLYEGLGEIYRDIERFSCRRWQK